ncbi:MAG: 7TM-DISM domain-containing protein, partial [Chitinophagaceae bacterium]|nr:7TM-DISM domain-containing protein [Chitinophagaceae bacterium]
MSNTTSLNDEYCFQRIIPRIIGILLFCVFAAIVFPIKSISQDSIIEINGFRNLRYIDTLVRYQLTETGTIKDDEIPSKLSFSNFLPSQISRNLPASWIEKELFLKFTLANDTDLPRTVSFYPGTYFTHIRIFKAKPGATNSTFQELKDSILPEKNIDGYHPISMQPNEKAVFFARLRFLRSSQNTLVPIIMRADYIDKHKAVAIVRRADLDIVTYIASGMMLMMIIYSLAAFIQNSNKEYLYYALYAFFTGLLLFLISFLGTSLNKFNFFYIEYLDLMILCASVFYYQAFTRTFLDTKNNHPFLEKVFKIGQGLNITMMIIYSIIYF